MIVGYCLALNAPAAPVREVIRAQFGPPVTAHCSRNARELLSALIRGSVDAAVLPWETTSLGGIVDSYDALIATPNVHAVRQIARQHGGDQTRFLVVGREPQPPLEGALGRTVIAAEMSGSPGLVRLLHLLADRGLHLVKLDSRPGTVNWTYRFVLEFEHYVSTLGMARVHADLRSTARAFRLLGTYQLPEATVHNRGNVTNRKSHSTSVRRAPSAARIFF